MKKPRLVIASVLKPVDDTRMFEKMGMTVAGAGMYEVFLVGYPSRGIPVHPTIRFRPLFRFTRLSFRRPLAHLKVLVETIKVKPDVLIVNTHEILIIAVLNRIFFGTRILYDIRENYYRNIRYSEAFPRPLRPPLAFLVRTTEWMLAPFFHHFFLAEKGYEKEIGFLGSRYTVLENRSTIQPAPAPRQSSRGRQLLFSGTLAESTGVFRAIGLASELHSLDTSVRLTLVGYCAQPRALDEIRRAIAGKEFISLLGGDELVPHAVIIEAIRTSDFGIITYPASPHTESSIPTKLYEYLAGKLPILLEGRQEWVNLCAPYDAAIAINFQNPDATGILAAMKASFYTSEPVGVNWEGEKLMAVLAGTKAQQQ